MTGIFSLTGNAEFPIDRLALLVRGENINLILPMVVNYLSGEIGSYCRSVSPSSFCYVYLIVDSKLYALIGISRDDASSYHARRVVSHRRYICSVYPLNRNNVGCEWIVTHVGMVLPECRDAAEQNHEADKFDPVGHALNVLRKVLLFQSTFLKILRHIDDLDLQFWNQGVWNFATRLREK